MRTLSAILLPLLLWMSGCNASGGAVNHTISSWKRDVELYVTQQGHGDLNCLRDANVVDGRREFSAITPARGGTDVVGVLLGPRTVADRSWMFYLVGTVKQNTKLSAPLPHDTQVREMHLIAVSALDSGFTWAMSSQSAEATAQYLASQTSRAASSGAASRATVFPADGDSFSLQLASDVATATVQPSGATWTLKLPAKP